MAGLIVSGREQLLKDARELLARLEKFRQPQMYPTLIEVPTAAIEVIERLLSVVAEAWDEGADQFVIEAEVSTDRLGLSPLPRLIGPFASDAEAREFLPANFPEMWGEWNVAKIDNPRKVVEG